jgi:hypothetical protein
MGNVERCEERNPDPYWAERTCTLWKDHRGAHEIGTAGDVYVVTEGTYSDYHVVAMFSTRKLAEAFIAADQARGYNDIEEYTLLRTMPKRERVFVIERYWSQPTIRRHNFLKWDFEAAPFNGEREEANYQRWGSGERAWGTDEGLVEKAWKEAHAAEEARDAGL